MDHCQVKGCEKSEPDMWVAPVRGPDGFTMTICGEHRPEVEQTINDLMLLVDRGEQPIPGAILRKKFFQ